MMQDGLTAWFLAWWYDVSDRVLNAMVKWECSWNKGFVEGEEFPKRSFSYWFARLYTATRPVSDV